MPDDQEIDDQEQEQQEERRVSMRREDIRKLEERAKRAEEAEALRRELAFVKAGVDTDTKLGSMFFKAYDGDLTVDAIKAAAGEVGLLKSDEPPVQEVSPEERKQTDERRALAQNAPPDVLSDENPYQTAGKTFAELVGNGAKEEDALSAYVNTVMAAAASGDKRVIWDPSGR